MVKFLKGTDHLKSTKKQSLGAPHFPIQKHIRDQCQRKDLPQKESFWGFLAQAITWGPGEQARSDAAGPAGA